MLTLFTLQHKTKYEEYIDSAPNKAQLIQRAVSAHAQCVGLRPPGGADDVQFIL